MTQNLKDLESKINRLDDTLTGLSRRVDELIAKQQTTNVSSSTLKDSIVELRQNFVIFSESVHERLKFLLEKK